MSYPAVAAALNHSRASTSARLVLITIAYFESDTGAWPAQETISRMTGLSLRSVKRAVKELSELHELDVIADSGDTWGARKTNRYFVILECPEGCRGDLSHKQASAEILNLAPIRRSQLVPNLVTIGDTRGNNRGQIR